MENERYRELNATVNYTIPATNMCGERAFTIGHSMINGTFEEEGVIGGKTGSTPQAGRVLTTACERDGKYIITTVMKSTTENFYQDTAVLLEYAYGIYGDHTMAPFSWTETGDRVVPTENVRIRYSPSFKGAVYGLAYSDQEYYRKGIYGDWSLVECDGMLLSILSEYLASEEPEKVPETKSWRYEEPTEEETTPESPASEETSEDETAPSTTRKGFVETEEQTETLTEEETERKQNTVKVLLIVFPSILAAALVVLWVVVLTDHVRRRKRHNRKKRR